jgi:hypothetical protein
MQSDPASAHDELVEAALAAFAHASGLGLFPDDDENWREDLVNGMRAALAVARPAIREECAEVADRQAWAHGGRHFNGPELNSAAIAAAIRAME